MSSYDDTVKYQVEYFATKPDGNTVGWSESFTNEVTGSIVWGENSISWQTPLDSVPDTAPDSKLHGGGDGYTITKKEIRGIYIGSSQFDSNGKSYYYIAFGT